MYALNCLVLLIQFIRLSEAVCTVDPFAANAPLLISPGTNDIIYPPHGRRNITFNSNQIVEFSCPGNEFQRMSIAIVEARCAFGEIFQIGTNQISWTDLFCKGYLKSTTLLKETKCDPNATLREIGFQLDESRFSRIMNVCFNSQNGRTLWTEAVISSSIGTRRDNPSRPEFFVDSTFEFPDPKPFYRRDKQRETINSILGLSHTSIEYIQTEMFLHRGHLAANCDFVYAAQQRATFNFYNVAPQWNIYNLGKWRIAEMKIRSYADSTKVNLIVYTGTHGVATLPNKIGEQTELYLGENEYLPVPELFWKVVYDPVNKKGVALISVNNPYVYYPKPICKNISLPSLNWDGNNHFYACNVADLRNRVQFYPKLNINRLLTIG